MMRLLRPFAFLCALGAASALAAGHEVVVDFDEITPGSYLENLTSNGFRLSPSSHVDIFGAPYATNGNAMGWDSSGGPNTDYLGQRRPDWVSVYIDYFEHPFAFTSFFLDQMPCCSAPGATGGATLTSSKGGVFDFTSLPSDTFASLSGPQWTGIDWIEFSYRGDPGAPIIHLDDLTFRVSGFAAPVPEPETYAMFLLGLGVVGFVSRRRARA